MAESFLQNAQLTGLDRQARRTEILRAKQAAALDADITAIEADMISYSPTLTNITIGNGTQSHCYHAIGNRVLVMNTITFGTTTAFTGWPLIAPPASLDTTYALVSQITATNAAVANYGGQVASNGATQVGPILLGTNGLYTFVSATVPFTFGTADTLKMAYWAVLA